MPSNRHNLILDEQAFQGLLSAAFIVQEYNDRVNHARLSNARRNGDRQNGDRAKLARPQPAEPEARPAAEPSSVCRYCGAPKLAEVTHCTSCGRDELRPGERLQRNWASMWLKSQAQEMWPVSSPEIRETAREDFPASAVERQPLPHSTGDSAPGLVARPVDSETLGHEKNETINDPTATGRSARDKSVMGRSDFDGPSLDGPSLDRSSLAHSALDDSSLDASSLDALPIDPPTFHQAALDALALNQAEEDRQSTTAAFGEADEVKDEAIEHLIEEGFGGEPSDPAVHTFQLSASDDVSPIEAGDDESAELTSDATDVGNRSLLQRLADLRVTLRFQRSNLYLGGAILIAALALLWPTAGSPQRATLSPWERTLITLGLAEAPEPAAHVQGDPGIEVWIDPHSALYYCPGEEQYGKTIDGRFSSQREAQMDRFEPAEHLACE
jgi:ribosomal protein L40E